MNAPESFVSPGLDAQRLAEARAWQARAQAGENLLLGDARALPAPVAQLAALQDDSPGVKQVCDGGLTAVVRCWQDEQGRRWAIKQARPQSRVRNADGETAFVNELLRHGELRALQAQGARLTGVHLPVWGSLRHGLLVSPWIARAQAPTATDPRVLTQVLTSGCALAVNGFFDWDPSPGNLLDDGQQVWRFDLGYCYRFDPRLGFNSAGDGVHAGNALPLHHVAERIETRWLSGAWLDLEQRRGLAAAVEAARLFNAAVAQAYAHAAMALVAKGGQAAVMAAWQQLAAQRAAATRDDAAARAFYVRQSWHAHWHDVQDDLSGRSCTATTLARLDWLREASGQHAELLSPDVPALADEPRRQALRSQLAQWVQEASGCRVDRS
ncbi:hypothetical protein [Ideonella paludis]|uniref:Aminoglycoside phosphotransferase domain-containing protein n=1 Tax=Ideonella paludis TaxID=1233411 RepID=A0ABS5DS04_9BURK|nr:hypothetical protein [Ideonella paludis]MBQ0933839.1 hypothetical protein [Ideonella paludis]